MKSDFEYTAYPDETVGTIYRVIDREGSFDVGDIIQLKRNDRTRCPMFKLKNSAESHYVYWNRLQRINNTIGEQIMNQRRTFKMLKDTVDVKKGTLVQEACDDGNQQYRTIGDGYLKHSDFTDYFNEGVVEFSRYAVEGQPNWFVEVFQVEPQYMTQAELDQFEAFKKQAKSTAKKRGRPAKATQ